MCGHYRYDNIGKHLGVVEQYKTDPMVGSTCVREKVIKNIKKIAHGGRMPEMRVGTSSSS